jgi:uncharacterized protein (DUF924 family)
VSIHTDHLRHVVGQYFTGSVSSLIVLFSISFSRNLFAGSLLSIKDPDALRQAAFNATRDVADARWDNGAYGWVTDHIAITRAFVNVEFAGINAVDQVTLTHWLANGAGKERPFAFARDFWFSAMIWCSRAGEFPERAEALLREMTPEQFGFAQEFCGKVQESLDDPAYHDAAADMCKQPPDDADLFQMTKFHIVFPDDDSEEESYDGNAPDPFMALSAVRKGNILHKHLAPIMSKGNPFETDALDRMVQVYVAQDAGIQQYAQDQARQTEAFALKNLYDWPRDA